MTGDKEMTLAVAAKDFFGFRPGTGIKDFLEEWKALTPADQQEIKAGLEQNGYKIKAPTA